MGPIWIIARKPCNGGRKPRVSTTVGVPPQLRSPGRKRRNHGRRPATEQRRRKDRRALRDQVFRGYSMRRRRRRAKLESRTIRTRQGRGKRLQRPAATEFRARLRTEPRAVALRRGGMGPRTRQPRSRNRSRTRPRTDSNSPTTIRCRGIPENTEGCGWRRPTSCDD